MLTDIEIYLVKEYNKLILFLKEQVAKLTDEKDTLEIKLEVARCNLDKTRDWLNDAERNVEKLTAENEKLKELNSFKEIEKQIIRKETIREMHTEIKKRCIKGGIYPAFVASTIDQVAQEKLEGDGDALSKVQD
jgi:DNA repair exonuclease SbcCD ATPase subunit